jgi:hypothetical protein
MSSVSWLSIILPLMSRWLILLILLMVLVFLLLDVDIVSRFLICHGRLN